MALDVQDAMWGEGRAGGPSYLAHAVNLLCPLFDVQGSSVDSFFLKSQLLPLLLQQFPLSC